MPYVYVYSCPSCDHDLEIRLCREFRRDGEGRRVDYEYPAEDVIQWPPLRVSGLRSHLWCPGCREVREHVIVELDEPAEHPVQAFLAAEARGLTGMESGPCPVCGTEMEVEPEDVPCAGCGTGTLVCVGEYEP
jgi:hypothetical protein